MGPDERPGRGWAGNAEHEAAAWKTAGSGLGLCHCSHSSRLQKKPDLGGLLGAEELLEDFLGADGRVLG